ncbi:hypothetical protein Ndes2526A_g01512 [Nannochloris sp. 'desiccata']
MENNITTEIVYGVLSSSLSQDNTTRSAAEKQLHTWESDSVPGFIGSLLKIAEELQNVPEESRLLAVVVAKNAVGSSWRKTVASREWSHVPDQEKAFIRSTALSLLLRDPSDRVALQLGLLITNIARFDVPRPWESLIPILATASTVESGEISNSKVRALSTLKYVLRALRSKRFVMEFRDDYSTAQDIDAMSKQVDKDRALMFQQARSLLGVLRQQWEGNFSSLLRQEAGWEVRGPLAVAGLACLRELLMLLLDIRECEGEFDSLMRECAQAAAAIAGPLFSGPAAAAAVEAGSAGSHTILLSKCWERLLQIALIAMDRHTVAFAQHIPAWASVCINTALLRMNSEAVHSIRPKTRVLLTRFVARAMLQPFYREEAATEEEHMMMLLPSAARARMNEALPALRAAARCLDGMVTQQDGRCDALVQSIVSKYIVLAPEELAEWGADPESFARQADVETSPDAETPRPCGVALLECALERNEEAVATSLVGLASNLQSQQLTRESVLPREAVYRAIGECFTHLRTRVDFGVWYTGELRMLLTSTDLSGIEGSILRARALWLIGVCGEELAAEAWQDAFKLAVQHMESPDLVVALMAVSAVAALIAVALEEQQFVGQPLENQRSLLEGTDAEGLVNGLHGSFGNGSSQQQQLDFAAQANAEFNAHVAVVEESMDAIMKHCFDLLPRLYEAESMVRMLQCISATVELLGDRVQPHLHSITSALPQVWSLVQGRSSEEGTGARVRLHCSLLAMLAHLIAKLGAAAAQQPEVAGVLLPLLLHATNTSDPQAEPLMEDGLKLWMAVLSAAPAVTPQLLEFVTGRLEGILKNGKDNAAGFSIAEGYALHGGATALAPILHQVATSITASISTAITTMAPRQGAVPGAIALGALTPEVANEAASALSLLATLQRVYDQLPTELEVPVKRAADMLCADYGMGVLRLPQRSVPLMECALEVVYRVLFTRPSALPALTDNDRGATHRLVDRWILLASSRDVGEMFIPSLAAAGRSRRHKAAVALCALVVADPPPGMRGEDRAAQSLVLGLKASREQKLFESDQQRLANLQPEDPDHQDQLLLRRLLLARGDPLRAVDATDAVRAAAGHVAAWQGKETLLQSLENIDTVYKNQMAALLAGQLSEAETDAAVASMAHAALS